MEILWNVLGIFFMVLLIYCLLSDFMFDVGQKVRQYKNTLKNKIRTKWKI